MKTGFKQKAMSLALLGAVIVGPKLQVAAQTPTNAGQSQGKHQEVIQFLELLKAGRTPARKFNVNDVPKWETKKIAGFISPGSLTVEDVNTKVVKKYSPEEVDRALAQKKGEVFQSFSHISFLYAKGKKQYSEIKYVEKPDGVLAVLATWYELEFVSDGDHLKLRKCKYVNSDKD